MKKGLSVRSWEAAQRIVREWEAGGQAVTATVQEACERWLADSEARNLKPQSLKKYRHVKKELTERFGEMTVGSVSVDDVRRMRESWKLSAMTTRKRLELVRAFFSFCMASEWTQSNPAKNVRPPAGQPLPTLPYSEEEWTRILWALDAYGEIHPQTPEKARRQLKALLLLMRYSGLRISDAVALRREKIDSTGRLFLYQAKTREPVLIPLPEVVLDALREADEGDAYYFWNGRSTLKTALTTWQERLKKLFLIAGCPEGHSHRLRDTFAVSLLQKGVSLEDVAKLLGHRSIQVTERHYSPWVRARQESLDQAVRKVWATEVQHDKG
jgi:integrase